MIARLSVVRTERLQFGAGGPVHAVPRGAWITLVALGPDNVETQWVDLQPDGSIDGPFALPFLVEAAAGDGDRLLLSGNEPGSSEAVILTVDAAGTVTSRDVVDGGTLTRWPVPVPVAAGLATVWESTDGLFWSGPPGPAHRIADQGTTNALVALAPPSGDPLVVRATIDGAMELVVPPEDEWHRLDVAGSIDGVAATTTASGELVVAGAPRGGHSIPIVVLDRDLAVRDTTVIEAPAGGVPVSTSVRLAAVGTTIVVSWSARIRQRQPGSEATMVDDHALAVVERGHAPAAPAWLPLQPAGAVYHALAGEETGRVIAVHGHNSAFVTELVVDGT